MLITAHWTEGQKGEHAVLLKPEIIPREIERRWAAVFEPFMLRARIASIAGVPTDNGWVVNNKGDIVQASDTVTLIATRCQGENLVTAIFSNGDIVTDGKDRKKDKTAVLSEDSI